MMPTDLPLQVFQFLFLVAFHRLQPPQPAQVLSLAQAVAFHPDRDPTLPQLIELGDRQARTSFGLCFHPLTQSLELVVQPLPFIRLRSQEFVA